MGLLVYLQNKISTKNEIKGYKEKLKSHFIYCDIQLFGEYSYNYFCSRKGRLGFGKVWRRVFFIRVISKTGC